MRLITFEYQGQQRIGAQIDTRIMDFSRAFPDLPTSMAAFLALGQPAMEKVRDTLLNVQEDCYLSGDGVTLLAPVPRPGNILCVGYNYAGHIGAGRTEVPEFPNIFSKTANTIIAPGQPIRIPRASQQVDHEAELAVVIGKSGREIAEADAMAYVAGYSIFNDVSARDYQKRGSQWLLGKSFDTFGPFGPVLVTADEVPNPHDLDFELTVNGVPKQRANTCDMIFSVPFLVSYLSQVLTLEPGDIIATGTPAKLPEAANPQVFLQPGDVVEITMEKLGTLTNPVAS